VVAVGEIVRLPQQVLLEVLAVVVALVQVVVLVVLEILQRNPHHKVTMGATEITIPLLMQVAEVVVPVQ
jgi:hypothetical protein